MSTYEKNCILEWGDGIKVRNKNNSDKKVLKRDTKVPYFLDSNFFHTYIAFAFDGAFVKLGHLVNRALLSHHMDFWIYDLTLYDFDGRHFML